jgi:peptidoglycan/LPS O-acetylase OafA/YrhL
MKSGRGANEVLPDIQPARNPRTHAALVAAPFADPATASRRIPALDGLRGVSITLVLLGHLAGTRHFLMLSSFAMFGDLGNLGVCVFFVISGFLITTLLNDEQVTERRIDLAAFYRRRAYRILPAAGLYLLALAVLAATTAGDRLSWPDWLHALTFTTNYHQHRAWNVGHLWSLSVEEQFYLLWPATIALLGRRHSLRLAAGAVALAPLCRVCAWLLWPDARDGIGETFPTVMDAIAVGCVLAGSASWLGERASYRRFLASRLFVAVPCVVLVCNAFDRSPSFFLPVGMTVRCIGIAAIVHWSVLRTNKVVTSVLDSPPLRFVGRISYSLYLWQQPFLNRHRAELFAAFPVNITCVCLCTVIHLHRVSRVAFSGAHRLSSRDTPQRR